MNWKSLKLNDHWIGAVLAGKRGIRLVSSGYWNQEPLQKTAPQEGIPLPMTRLGYIVGALIVGFLVLLWLLARNQLW